jgi:hypothetical protein
MALALEVNQYPTHPLPFIILDQQTIQLHPPRWLWTPASLSIVAEEIQTIPAFTFNIFEEFPFGSVPVPGHPRSLSLVRVE